MKCGHGFELWFANNQVKRRAQLSKRNTIYLLELLWNSAIQGIGK